MSINKFLDTRNQDLFDSIISSGLKLKYKRNKANHWSAFIEDDTYFIISHSPTKWPIASLTHELLHIYTQKICGYKRIMSGFSGNIPPNFFINICGEMDNNLQHIKFYDDFRIRGFHPHEFYSESDLKGEQILRRNLSNPGLDIYSLVLYFCTFITPGGIISHQARNEIRELFRVYNNGAYENTFLDIEQIFKDWKVDTSYNSEPYWNRFFQIFNCGQVWLSYEREAKIDVKTGFYAG